MEDLIILKIGGSVLTDKHSETPKVNFGNLKRIAKEISVYKKPLILIHGAGSYGHQIVKRTNIHKGIETKQQLIDFAETQRLQNELNSIVCKELIKQGVPAIPCQASASALMSSGKLETMDINAIKGFLEIGLVPVLYGVPAYDSKQKCSILSGDEIAPYLAIKLKAKKVIHATDVDGVFTADPKKDKTAKLIPLITKKNLKEVKKAIKGSTNIDVTGGMIKKITEVLKLSKYEIETSLINGNKKGNIKKELNNEKILKTKIR